MKSKLSSLFFILFFLLAIMAKTIAAASSDITASPEQYYNQALTEEAQGDLAAASLSLRRALVLDPTLGIAQAQLQEVLKKMGLPAETTWQTKFASRFVPEYLTIIGALIGWSAALIVIWIFFACTLSSPARAKEHKVWLIGALFFFFLGHAIMALGLIIDPRIPARHAVILIPKRDARATLGHRPDQAETTPLRATPVDNATVITQLPTGSRLTLLSRHGVWAYVRAGLGEEGWISSGSLESLIPKN